MANPLAPVSSVRTVRLQADAWSANIIKTDEGYSKQLKAYREVGNSLEPISDKDFDFEVASTMKTISIDGKDLNVYTFDWNNGAVDVVKTGDAAVDDKIKKFYTSQHTHILNGKTVMVKPRYMDDNPQDSALMTFRKQSRNLATARKFEAKPF